MYKCVYCKKEYATLQEAVDCAKSHDLVLIYLKRSDIIALLRFLYSKDDSLLTESLVNSLSAYKTFNQAQSELTK